MTQQNHRANVWITPETREQLKEISMAHGGNSRKELSPGIRVAAGFHGRLVEEMRQTQKLLDDLQEHACACNFYISEDHRCDVCEAADRNRAVLKEIEEAR